MSSLFNVSLLVVIFLMGFVIDLENNIVSMIFSMFLFELVIN